MIGSNTSQKRLIVVLTALGILIMLGGSVRGQSPDPTQMSPQIAELLNGLASSQHKKANTGGEFSTPNADSVEQMVEPLVIRLRGMVLRDGDRGIAFLIAGEQRITLPLDRKQTLNNKFSIGGEQFELVDFSPYALQIRNLSTFQTLHVN